MWQYLRLSALGPRWLVELKKLSLIWKRFSMGVYISTPSRKMGTYSHFGDHIIGPANSECFVVLGKEVI